MTRHCDEYIHFLALERNASRNTIASYRLDVGRYVRFLEAQNGRAVDRIFQSEL